MPTTTDWSAAAWPSASRSAAVIDSVTACWSATRPLDQPCDSTVLAPTRRMRLFSRTQITILV